MKTITKNNGEGYVSPLLYITAVHAEAGFCASGDATLNGFNEPESVEFEFND